MPRAHRRSIALPGTLAVSVLGVAFAACVQPSPSDAGRDAIEAAARDGALPVDAHDASAPDTNALDTNALDTNAPDNNAPDAADVADANDASDALDASDASDAAPDALDAADDAALDDADAHVTCSTPMTGRDCYTTCSIEYVDADGAVGTAVVACEFYCDPLTTSCYTTDGFLADCNLEGDGDGGITVHC